MACEVKVETRKLIASTVFKLSERNLLAKLESILINGLSWINITKIVSHYNIPLINVAEANQRRCLEESGQWLENVD